MKVSIVVPAHNEEENIAHVIKEIENFVDIPYELVVVNDHSLDNTRKIIEELTGAYSNVRLIENNLDKGFANALKTGFSNTQGEAVVPIMADSSDDLSALRAMFDKLQEGFDVVCGCRYIRGGARLGGSKLKGFLSCFAGHSLYYLLGIPTHDIANAFKMYRKKVIETLDIKSSSFEVSMEIPLKAHFFGFKITEVPTVWRERAKGKSSFKMFKLLPSYLKLYIWAICKRIKRGL